MSLKFWKSKFVTIIVLPTIAAVLLAGVSVFQGHLHKYFGIDPWGRKLDDSPHLSGPKEASRRPISTTALITQIQDDLKRVEAARQSDCRYFSLAHRYNNPACTEEILERERQAFREIVRLLSPVDKAPQVTAIDREQVLFRVGLSELGWTEDQWSELARHYPYGLSHASSTSDELREADTFVRRAVGDTVPLVRADWFVAALVRSPLGGPGGTLGPWTRTPPADIRFVADSYAGQTVSLEVAALELEVEPGPLRDVIAGDEVLREAFGLGPLLSGQTVTREWWESDRNLSSPFQELAGRIKLGKAVIRR